MRIPAIDLYKYSYSDFNGTGTMRHLWIFATLAANFKDSITSS